MTASSKLSHLLYGPIENAGGPSSDILSSCYERPDATDRLRNAAGFRDGNRKGERLPGMEGDSPARIRMMTSRSSSSNREARREGFDSLSTDVEAVGERERDGGKQRDEIDRRPSFDGGKRRDGRGEFTHTEKR